MRKLIIAAATVAVSTIALGGTAGAVPGHTSCRGLGQHNAGEAQTGVLVDEVHYFGPGNIDDVVALVQIGGTFGDEVVPALCTLK